MRSCQDTDFDLTFPSTAKRSENLTRSGVFLMKCVVCRNMIKTLLRVFDIHLLYGS